ncbi:MAG: filamentous hemagglutinin N-terminal domain-containing protein [Cyanobacteria bacterium P01_C01_bin.118]
MVSYRHWLTLLSCTSALFPFAAMALPVPDTTVGTQLVPSAPDSIEIQGGTSVGQNLFHSFESFNIQTGESVFFLSPADINHIFSRVTGGSASEIDGVLGTLGSDANLFLINPNGIAFGPNASLDVQGSLIATTSDTVELGPDGVFRATQ